MPIVVVTDDPPHSKEGVSQFDAPDGDVGGEPHSNSKEGVSQFDSLVGEDGGVDDPRR